MIEGTLLLIELLLMFLLLRGIWRASQGIQQAEALGFLAYDGVAGSTPAPAKHPPPPASPPRA